MKHCLLALSALVLGAAPALVLGAAPVLATDLTKIDRTIAKEPAYQSKPKYCLLAFGREAKVRIWLVLDGDVLYVDRNGNGDLTEKDERLTGKSAPGDWSEAPPSAGVELVTVAEYARRRGYLRAADLAARGPAVPGAVKES